MERLRGEARYGDLLGEKRALATSTSDVYCRYHIFSRRSCGLSWVSKNLEACVIGERGGVSDDLGTVSYFGFLRMAQEQTA